MHHNYFSKISHQTSNMKLSWPAITSVALAAYLMDLTNATTVRKTCTDYIIPFESLTTTNQIWTNPWKDNYELIDFVSNFADGISGSPFATETVPSTGDYNISATFCSPVGTSNPSEKSGIVLLMSPGLNFDKSYVKTLHIRIHN